MIREIYMPGGLDHIKLFWAKDLVRTSRHSKPGIGFDKETGHLMSLKRRKLRKVKR